MAESKQAIKPCVKKCASNYQDTHYGKGIRVMNPTEKPAGFKCTVCGTKQ